ncbi:beta-ketoacyl-ACP synthase 3 [Nonomuraea sp. NPDC005650]|uniref:beta-ketoacyl-ACP synthase 3 n=1 Tax=Nonomuraea sp. NPDC005650 TaxID=3157045 RepID=UPI0033ABFE4E
MTTLGSTLLGLGTYRPVRIVPNREIADRLGTTEEWITRRTGIQERRWANDKESVAMMGTAAAEEAIAAAAIPAASIDCIIVATISSLRQTPAVAPEIAHLLGANGTQAFDINTACAGFCSGIALADSLVRSRTAQYVLVIGAERMTDITDPDDHQLAPLFADGAGAAVVGPCADDGIGPVVWGSQGSLRQVVQQADPWPSARGEQAAALVHTLRMQGTSLFQWVLNTVPEIACQATAAAGLTLTDIDVFVPHQANLRITQELIHRLDLRDDVIVAATITDHGNTSGASIPQALTALHREGRLHPGSRALLLGFGAGLSYAAQVVRLP